MTKSDDWAQLHWHPFPVDLHMPLVGKQADHAIKNYGLPVPFDSPVPEHRSERGFIEKR